MKSFKRWICILVALALVFTMSFTTTFAASKPGKVTNLTVKSTTYNSVKLSWKKVSGATGYQVYRATSKNGTYKLVKTISKGSTVTYKNKKLKSNKTYYYKVRAIKKSGSKTLKGKYSAKVSAKTKKCLFVSKTNVSFKKYVNVKVTLKQNASVSYKIANEDIVSCKWGEWDGDTINLKITGKKPGKTKVYVTNTHNKEKITINVTVKNPIEISIPSTPIIMKNYGWDGKVECSGKINKISYTAEKDSYDDTYNVKLTFEGVKTYDEEGNGYSRGLDIGWKLYKGNIVVASDTTYTEAIAVGDGFKETEYIWEDLEPGKYKLVILDVD